MSLFKELKLDNAATWSHNSQLARFTMRCNKNMCESKILAESSINTIEGEFIRKFTSCSMAPVNKRKRKIIENVTSQLYSDCKVTLTVQPLSHEENIMLDNNIEDIIDIPILKLRRNNDVLKVFKLKKCAKDTLKTIAVDEPEFILKSETGDDNKADKLHDLSSSANVCLTLKYLIRYLHISNPIRSVMCLLGKAYPINAMDFVRFGLGEEWDINLAGKRMKLPNPVTWETELSAKGNTVEIWESLILSQKLPYMAMLRNLRNLLQVGVSLTTHEAVIKKMTNPHAVANSKQLPLRFFTAYKILHSLEEKLKYNALLMKVNKIKPLPGKRKKVRSSGIKKLMKKKAVVKPLCYDQPLLERYRRALDVAFGLSTRYNLPPIPGHSIIICNPSLKKEKKSQSKSSGPSNDATSLCILLTTMCFSLCESASVYICSDSRVSTIEELVEDNKGSALPEGLENVLEKAHILQKLRKEYSYKHDFAYLGEILDSIVINRQPLDSVFMFGDMIPVVDMFVEKYQALVDRLNAISSSSEFSLSKLCRGAWTYVPAFTDQVIRFAAETNRMKSLIEHVDRMDKLYGLDQVRINVSTKRTVLQSSLTTIERPLQLQWRCARVFISSTFRDMHGERDLICGLLLPELRRMAAHQLRVHLTEVDLRWGVPEEAACSPQALSLCLEQAANSDLFVLLVGNRYGWTPKQALIDALPKPLLQRIRKFYSPGMSITEMEYHIVKHTILSHLPLPMKRQLNASQTCEHVRDKIFAFIRDPKAIDIIPAAEKLNFEETNEDKRNRLNSFKEVIKSDGVVILDKYAASFTGLVQGQLMMSSLNELTSSFARTLFRALSLDFSSKLFTSDKIKRQSELTEQHTWFGFLHHHVESVAREIAPRQLADLERVLAKDILLRGKQCRSLRLLAEKLTKSTNPRFQAMSTSGEGKVVADGCILLLTGCSGCGKTTHLAAAAMRMAKPESWEPHPYRVSSEEGETNHPPVLVSTDWTQGRRPTISAHVVLTHFTEGLPATGLTCNRRLYSLLDTWIHQLRSDLQGRSAASPMLSSMLDQAVQADQASGEEDTSLGGKVACFKRLLKIAGYLTQVRYAFLLDDADNLQPRVFEWLPDIVPQNILFVFTCDSTSSIARSLSRRPDCLAYVVSSLSMAEKSAAVRSLLARYGKVLNESGISNQLIKLVNKRGSTIPLYLKLACEELRLYATFEELDAQIRQLPESLSNLVNHVIARVEADCGPELTQMALGLLCESQIPLAADQLKHLLEIWLASTLEENSFDSQWKRISASGEGRECEALIASVLKNQQGNKEKRKGRKRRLTPLAFHWLLAGLRPLLADSGDPATTDSDTLEEQGKVRTHDWWLRLRSPEVLGAVRLICFQPAELGGDKLSHVSILGYHKSTNLSVARQASSSGKRSRFTIEISSEDGVLQPVNLPQAHWLLATGLRSAEYKVYHLILADELDTAFRLLTSPTYLLTRISAGPGTRNLAEDFQLFEETYRRRPTGVYIDVSQLVMMRKFIISHYFTLCKLASEVSLSPPEINRADHHMLRCSWPFPDAPTTDKWISLSSPMAVYQRPASNQAYMTALAVSTDGELMAYGTSVGSVILVEVRTLREKCTYYGHSASILSLCFISKRKNTFGNSFSNTIVDAFSSNLSSKIGAASAPVADDCWLVSTSQDGTTNVGSTVKGVGNLICLTNSRGGSFPRRPVTSCAWHPDRRLLATGSLDCTLTLWNLGWSDDAMDSNMIPVGNCTRQFRYTRFRTASSPVNAVAFRLPDQQLTETRSHDKGTFPCDVVAAGCWDGTIRLYDLEAMRPLKILRGTRHSITSLAFSPGNGGSLLAAQDITGQLLLWNSDNLSLLGGVLSATTKADTGATVNPSSGMSMNSLNYHGQICFSKPTGRHLIQSTNTGLLKVWSGQLGVPLSSWLSLEDRMQDRPGVTAFTCDPSGAIFLFGLVNGGTVVTNCSSGQPISMASAIRNQPAQNDRTCVQSVACCRLLRPDSDTQQPDQEWSSLLAVFGFASGSVRVYHYQVRYAGSSQFDEEMVADSISLVDTFWPHSIGDGGDGEVGDSGGTLCVAADEGVAVSGGGNGQCWVAFFAPDDDCTVRLTRQLWLTDPSGAVTAVALDGNLLAAGTNARVVHTYTLDRQAYQCTPYVVVNYAARDWITALSWLKPNAAGSRPVLVVGSFDQNVSIFRETSGEEWRQLDCTRGPGGAVIAISSYGPYVAASSIEGKVRLWKYNTIKRCLDTQTTLDCSLSKHELTDDRSEPVGRIINLKLSASTVIDPAHRKNKAGDLKGYLIGTHDFISDHEEEEEVEEEEEEEDIESEEEAMEKETGMEEMSRLNKADQEAEDHFPGVVVEDDGAPGPPRRRRGTPKASEDTQLSGLLRLTVGQQVAAASSPYSFRFRTFAPLLPELCYVLPGHSGLSVNGLVAGPGETVVSLASQPEANSNLKNDIRLWHLFSSEIEGGSVARLEHYKAVTCIDAQPKKRPCAIVSGSLDGTLILSIGDQFKKFVDDPSCNEHSQTFAPVLRLSFGGDPIASISCGFITSHHVFHLFVAVGKQIWHVCFPTSMLITMQQHPRQSVTISQLLKLAERTEDQKLRGLSVSNIELPVAIFELASCEKDCRNLVVSCTDGFVRVVLFSLSEAQSWPLSSPDNTFWYRCIRFCGNTVTMIKDHQNCVAEKTGVLWKREFTGELSDEVGSRTKNKRPAGFKIGQKNLLTQVFTPEDANLVSKEEQRVTFLLPFANRIRDDLRYYLMVKASSESQSVALTDVKGRTILDFQPVSSSVTITGIDCVPLTEDAKTVLVVVAASDGNVCLYKLDQDTRCVNKLGFYPTGEIITTLQLSQEEPFQISIGCQSGKIYVFKITHP